jgi:hypothetical protein
MTDLERRAAVNGLLATAVAVGFLPGEAGPVVANTRSLPELIQGALTVPTSNTADPSTSGFAQSLLSSRPHPSLGHHADTFGRLMGSWAGEYRDQESGQPLETGSIEVHFGWVLQGRAVQDTWIAPPREPANAGSVLKRQTYGTTVRVFHPEIEAWRAVWLNPVRGKRNDLIGRRIGDDIVQFCLDADRPEKWVFSRITARSFLWSALLLGDDGVTWVMDTEFQLHRTA